MFRPRKARALAVAISAVMLLGGATPEQVSRGQLGNQRLLAHDFEGALAIFRGLCNEGIPQACQGAAQIEQALQKSQRSASAEQKFDAGDILGALREYKALCNEGDSNACENIRRIDVNIGRGSYVRNKIVAGDIDGALADLRAFCAEGSQEGCHGVRAIETQLRLQATAVPAAPNEDSNSSNAEDIPPSTSSINVVPTAASGSGVDNPTSGMAPEVALAYRQTSDPAIRDRIVRNAALYARNRPTLTVRANTGTRCIRPELTNYRFSAVGEQWTVEWRLTNTCPAEQLVIGEMTAGLGYSDPPILWTVGFFPTTWDRKRDPGVGFKPHNPEGDKAHWRIAGGQTNSGEWVYSATTEANRFELWIGSCESHAPGQVGQVMFRPVPNMHEDPRVACVPGLQGKNGY